MRAEARKRLLRTNVSEVTFGCRRASVACARIGRTNPRFGTAKLINAAWVSPKRSEKLAGLRARSRPVTRPESRFPLEQLRRLNRARLIHMVLLLRPTP